MSLKKAQEDLQAERARHTDTKNELREAQQEAQEFCQRWKQTAGELNRCSSGVQASNQLSDSELIEKVNMLRYNIRTFAQQYFGDTTRISGISPKFYDFCEPYSLCSATLLKDYMLSSVSRPALVHALLWSVVVDHVFGGFRWGLEASLSTALYLLHRFLGMSFSANA